MKPGMFVDPPATFQRKPTAAPVVRPEECIAMALTVSQWKPGGMIDPDGTVVKLVMGALDREGWEIRPKERSDHE